MILIHLLRQINGVSLWLFFHSETFEQNCAGEPILWFCLLIQRSAMRLDIKFQFWICTFREIDIMLPFRLPNTNFCEHKTCNRKESPTALVQAIAFVYRDKSTPHSFSAHISLLYPKYGQDLRQFVRITRFPCNIWLLDRCQVQIPNQMNWMWNERNQKKSV